jgi:hypothetical protein
MSDQAGRLAATGAVVVGYDEHLTSTLVLADRAAGADRHGAA